MLRLLVNWNVQRLEAISIFEGDLSHSHSVYSWILKRQRDFKQSAVSSVQFYSAPLAYPFNIIYAKLSKNYPICYKAHSVLSRNGRNFGNLLIVSRRYLNKIVSIWIKYRQMTAVINNWCVLSHNYTEIIVTDYSKILEVKFVLIRTEEHERTSITNYKGGPKCTTGLGFIWS